MVRLLQALAAHLEREPGVAARTDVVVVVDGSTDGTVEAAAAVPMPVTCRVVWQANAGLAAARNRGWELAGGDLVLFLDDDFVPADGFIRHHLLGHADGRERVVVGPCDIPDDVVADEDARRWYTGRYAELADAGTIRRFDQFAAANGSFPVSLLRRIGGFDETFRGYGLEDYELGYRLLNAGCEVRFVAAAGVRHLQRRPRREKWHLRRQEGRNVVRFAELHPEAVDLLFPEQRPGAWRLLHRLGVRRASTLWAIAWSVAWFVPVQDRLAPGGRHTLFRLADAAALLAGVADEDPTGELIERALGRRG